MNTNEKDLKAELMKLINGEHKDTENRVRVVVFVDGTLEELIPCDSFIFDGLAKGGDCPFLCFSDDYDLAVFKTDIDYQIIKMLEKNGAFE